MVSFWVTRAAALLLVTKWNDDPRSSKPPPIFWQVLSIFKQNHVYGTFLLFFLREKKRVKLRVFLQVLLMFSLGIGCLMLRQNHTYGIYWLLFIYPNKTETIVISNLCNHNYFLFFSSSQSALLGFPSG
jgi:hypothetical protein